jgi:hypothetical protein
MNYEDIHDLKNDKYFFVYSQGCLAGLFTMNPEKSSEGCIAEAFTVESEKGAFAGIWNTQFGKGYFGWAGDGPSQRYHREFWDAVFGEGMLEIGRALQDSKIDNIPVFGNGTDFWQLTLFGDPTLKIKIPNNYKPNTPKKPSKPSGSTKIKPKVKYTYTTSTTDPNGDQLYYNFTWGDDGNYSGWIGPYNSGEVCEGSYEWTKISKYYGYGIKVKAKDEDGHESPWSDYLLVSQKSKNKPFTKPLFLDILARFPLLQRLINLR